MSETPSPAEKLEYLIAQGGHAGAVAEEILAKFNPDQERDDHGRFGGGGGGGESSHAQERAAGATQAANAEFDMQDARAARHG